MKQLYPLVMVVLFLSVLQHATATNVVIIESESYNAGHLMDENWLSVCNTLGYNASIYPQSTLSTDTWFDTTDILIVSSGVIALAANAVDTIQAFLLQGGRVYLQGEYLPSYDANAAFQQIVNATGGSFTWAANTTAGDLEPMTVFGSLSTTPNAVTPLSYFWYGDAGTFGGCNSHIEPFLQYEGQYYGFIYCCPSNTSRMISTSDQDWVNTFTSIPLMENILVNLAGTSYTCVESGGGLSVNLGPDQNICTGQSVTLKAITLGATSYLWSTGSVADSISVDTGGTYWVQVSNGSCTASDTVVVTSGPLAPVTLNPVICTNQSYTLPGGTVVTAAGVYNDTLVSVGGCDSVVITNLSVQGILSSLTDTAICSGSTYTLPSGTIVSVAGVYNDTVLSAGGCDSVVTTNLAISQQPVITFLGNDTAYCGAFSRVLNAGNAGALWSTSATGAQITVNAPGIYWAMVSNGCGVVADTIVIAQNTLPVINLPHDTLACGGQALQLDAGNGDSLYEWNNSATAEIINAAVGSYQVTVTNTSNCSASASILVIGDAISDTMQVLNAACGQDNGSVQANVGQGIAPYIYNWNNGDTGAVASNLGAGTYTVTVADAAGCSVTGSGTVVAGGSSPVTISSPDTVICPGDTTSICATSGFSSYAWSTGDTGMCIHTPYGGNYSVSAVYSAGCVVTSNTINIQVLTPSPVTVSVQGDTMTCYPSLSYQWLYNGQPIPGDTTNALIATQTGDYAVTIKGQNGCYSTSSVIDITTLGISDPTTGSQVHVYPNPTIGSWQLAVGNDLIGAVVVIYDAAGQVVFKSEIRSPQSEISLTDAAKGVYLMQIQNAGYSYNLKLIKLN